MEKNLKHSLSNSEAFSLINAANIQSSLLSANFANSIDSFLKFSDLAKGIPILIPADKKLFQFEEKNVFNLDQKQILNVVYGLSDKTYVGFKHAFPEFSFLSSFSVRERYKSYFDTIVKQNWDTIAHVSSLRDRFKRLGAFQTRNIPHFGHEKIIQRMLEICDHVVVNPVIGPKKAGDVKLECLSKVFTILNESKYSERISFHPIFANMFYAGPREAMHHVLIRQRIGFQHFSVGRDHAGADGAYHPKSAPNCIEKYKKNLEINVMTHSGAVFCKKCSKTILLGDCDHSIENLIDISGSDFRSSILAKRLFAMADKKMQLSILKNKAEIFEV